MVLAVLGPDFRDFLVALEAVAFQTLLNHAQAAVRNDGAFQRSVGLQTDDDFERLINVAGVVRGDAGRDVSGNVEHAAFGVLFFLQQIGHFGPQCRGPGGRAGQEGIVTCVRRVILLDEVADIDFCTP